MVSTRSIGCSALLSLVAACSQSERPITELVLVADTDIVGVDKIQFVVTSEDDPTLQKTGDSQVDGTTPSYLSLVREEGPLGPLLVTARALAGDAVRLERTQRVWFVADQRRVVPLHLVGSCIPKQCSDACDETGCIPRDLGELGPWTGRPPRIGGRIEDLDARIPEEAGGQDATSNDSGSSTLDAGGTGNGGGGGDAGDAEAGVTTTDSGAADAGTDAGPTLTYCVFYGASFDLQSNPSHCGSCSNACPDGYWGSHAIAACEDGSCAYDCSTGYGNCDGLYSNGCEKYLNTDWSHCGRCNSPCVFGQTCVGGICVGG